MCEKNAANLDTEKCKKRRGFYVELRTIINLSMQQANR